MRRLLTIVMSACAALLPLTPALAQGAKALKKCPVDAVVSGTVCLDKYEATIWRISDPLGVNAGLVKKVKAGKATAAELSAAGATQLGIGADNYSPCTDNGQNCVNDIYAVSLAGASPSRYLTWFQAQQACENAGKRLPSNAEWQAAVAGTPDPGPDNGTTDCNSTSLTVSLTGARTSCVSADGAFDMVGNLYEWVADWVPRAPTCGSWGAGISPTGDVQCLAGAATTDEPGALLRGGSFSDLTNAGPLAVNAFYSPASSFSNLGVRCVR